ncbi:hypothetical protein H0H93_015012, partial [Arthromyces matolae]
MSIRAPNKRPRSPSPNDLPNKRPSLAIDRFKVAYSSGDVTPQSPASSSRFPSEDWVHQADGLSIDSPVILKDDQDEEMNMDSDEPIPIKVQAKRPTLHPIQTSQTNMAHLSLFRQYHHHTPSSATSSSMHTPPGPLVHVFPPTPPIPSSASIDVLPMQTRPSTPVNDPSSISVMDLSSPEPSFTTPRKQRFTMGPRADCIKCQMNVKGHS